VNSVRTDIPSFIVKEEDVVGVREKSRKSKIFKEIIEDLGEKTPVPTWLELNKEEVSGKVVRSPEREDITDDIKENLIVELYSK